VSVLDLANFTNIISIFLEVLCIDFVLIIMAVLDMPQKWRLIGEGTLTSIADELFFFWLLLDYLRLNFNLWIWLKLFLCFYFIYTYFKMQRFDLLLLLHYYHVNGVLHSKGIECAFEGRLWLMLVLYKLHKILVSKHSGKFNIIKAGILLLI
jgi:hypothetical protein